jgi:hypothetical protein
MPRKGSPAAACSIRFVIGPVLKKAFALRFLPGEFTGAADRLGLLPGALLRGLLVEFPALHLAEGPLTLHLLFQSAKGLLDIVVADADVDDGTSPNAAAAPARGRADTCSYDCFRSGGNLPPGS